MSLLLQAEKRDKIGKAMQTARKEGKTPAILYGYQTENISLFVPSREFNKIYHQVKKRALFDLDIQGQKKTVIIVDVQRDPISGEAIHADFQEIHNDRKLHTTIPIIFKGEAPAVKAKGANFMAGSTLEIEISCLPQSLMSEVEVDLTVLKEFNDIIRAKDLVLKEGVTLVSSENMVIASVKAPKRVVEEVVAAPAAAAATPAAAPAAAKAPEKKK